MHKFVFYPWIDMSCHISFDPIVKTKCQKQAYVQDLSHFIHYRVDVRYFKAKRATFDKKITY